VEKGSLFQKASSVRNSEKVNSIHTVSGSIHPVSPVSPVSPQAAKDNSDGTAGNTDADTGSLAARVCSRTKNQKKIYLLMRILVQTKI
jgi:hypothetical protein